MLVLFSFILIFEMWVIETNLFNGATYVFCWLLGFLIYACQKLQSAFSSGAMIFESLFSKSILAKKYQRVTVLKYRQKNG